MLRFLPACLLFLSLATMHDATQQPVLAEDLSAAQSLYDQAQALKRDNRLDAARASFERVAEMSGDEDATWAGLAKDELRYGLPLHEARQLTLQLASSRDYSGSRQILSRIDAMHRQLLADNSDRPDRIAAIEQLRDQLALVRQSVGGAEQASASAVLNQLRNRVRMYQLNQGHWPDRRFLESELAGLLRQSGFSEGRIEILNFYPSSELFYATLRDTRNGTETKLKGDNHGIRLESQ